jgi:hypothetical protein
MRLTLYTYAFAEDNIKDAREQLCHNLLGSGLILVRCYSEEVTLFLEGFKQFLNSIIRTGEVAVMFIVIGYEVLA